MVPKEENRCPLVVSLEWSRLVVIVVPNLKDTTRNAERYSEDHKSAPI
jgi:hypothetical protein